MKRNALIKVILIGLFVFGLDRLGAFLWLREKVVNLTGCFQAEGYQEIIGSQAGGLSGEIDSLQAQIMTLEEENAQARRLLSAGIKPETKFFLGKITGMNKGRAIIVVDTNKKIREGASVVFGRVYLGKVESVAGKQIEAVFLGNPNLKVPVKIWQDKESAERNYPSLAKGILLSNEKGELKVEEILASETIENDNIVGFLSESGDVFLIGKVVEVFPSEDKVFQQAKLERLADPDKIISVGIVQ